MNFRHKSLKKQFEEKLQEKYPDGVYCHHCGERNGILDSTYDGGKGEYYHHWCFFHPEDRKVDYEEALYVLNGGLICVH